MGVRGHYCIGIRNFRDRGEALIIVVSRRDKSWLNLCSRSESFPFLKLCNTSRREWRLLHLAQIPDSMLHFFYKVFHESIEVFSLAYDSCLCFLIFKELLDKFI